MRIFLIILFLSLTTPCLADVYVFYETSTNEVLFITEDKSEVVVDQNSNISMETLPNEIMSYNLREQYTDYKLINKRFVVDTQKISDRENKRIEDENTRTKSDQDFQSAKQKLIGIGLTADEVDALK